MSKGSFLVAVCGTISSTITKPCAPCALSDPPNVTALEPIELIVNHTQMVEFSCQVSGIPLPNVTWIKMLNDDTFVLDTTQFIKIDQKVNNSHMLISTLTFLNTTRDDQSSYTCVGNNSIKNVISSPENDTVNLLVQGKGLTLLFIYVYVAERKFSQQENILLLEPSSVCRKSFIEICSRGMCTLCSVSIVDDYYL